MKEGDRGHDEAGRLVRSQQDITCSVEDFEYHLNCSGRTLSIFMPVNNMMTSKFL